MKKFLAITAMLLFTIVTGTIFAASIDVHPAWFIGPMTLASAFISNPSGVLSMSTTAGYFDETNMQDIRVKAEMMGLNTNILADYKPRKDILEAILAKETARITPLQSKLKDAVVEIEWLNACGLETDTFNNCSFCGPEGSSNIEQKTLSKELSVPWTVYEDQFLTNDFETNEMIAKQILRADKLIIDALAQYSVNILNLNGGTNLYTGGRGNVVANLTYILPSLMTPEAFAYFVVAAQQNLFDNPYIIDGGNFSEAFRQRQLADPKNDRGFFNAMDYYDDIFNISAVNSGSFGTRTYLLNKGAMAFAQKTYYDNAVRVEGEHKRMSMKSPLFPALEYDLFEKTSCDTREGKRKFAHCFQLSWKGDIFFNPAGCDSGNTGLLIFECGTGS